MSHSPLIAPRTPTNSRRLPLRPQEDFESFTLRPRGLRSGEGAKPKEAKRRPSDGKEAHQPPPRKASASFPETRLLGFQVQAAWTQGADGLSARGQKQMEPRRAKIFCGLFYGSVQFRPDDGSPRLATGDDFDWGHHVDCF